jgi:hypothetical protein
VGGRGGARWNSAVVLRSNEDLATTPFGVVTSFYESRGWCCGRRAPGVDIERNERRLCDSAAKGLLFFPFGGLNDALIGS